MSKVSPEEHEIEADEDKISWAEQESINQRKKLNKQVGLGVFLLLLFGTLIVMIFVLTRDLRSATASEIDNPCFVTFDDDSCTPRNFENFCKADNVNDELYACSTRCRELYELSQHDHTKYCGYESACVELADINFPWCT